MNYSNKQSGALLVVTFAGPFSRRTAEGLEAAVLQNLGSGSFSVVRDLSKPFLKGKGTTAAVIDITGIIGLTSARFQGSIALCFPEATFLTVLSNMLGEEYAEMPPDLEDGAGELMNIIFGQAKVELNERGHTIENS